MTQDTFRVTDSFVKDLAGVTADDQVFHRLCSQMKLDLTTIVNLKKQTPDERVGQAIRKWLTSVHVVKDLVDVLFAVGLSDFAIEHCYTAKSLAPILFHDPAQPPPAPSPAQPPPVQPPLSRVPAAVVEALMIDVAEDTSDGSCFHSVCVALRLDAAAVAELKALPPEQRGSRTIKLWQDGRSSATDQTAGERIRAMATARAAFFIELQRLLRLIGGSESETMADLDKLVRGGIRTLVNLADAEYADLERMGLKRARAKKLIGRAVEAVEAK